MTSNKNITLISPSSYFLKNNCLDKYIYFAPHQKIFSMSRFIRIFALDFKQQNMMNTFVDTEEDTDAMEVLDDLTPAQRAYWQNVIDTAHYDPDEPKRYITLEEFGRELTAAVRSKR